MPVSVARKLEFFLRREFPEVDARLIPIVLTPEQVGIYDLPRIEIKDTEKQKAQI
jgi:hypothetical protein